MYHTKTAMIIRKVFRIFGLNRITALVKRGPYEHKFDDSIKLKTKTSRIFWDIGANQGIYTSKFLKGPKCELVYAFEPNNSIAENLIEKYKDQKKLIVIEAAISNFSGSAFLSYGADSLQATTKLCENNEADATVKCHRFFELITTMDKPDLVKIDVEGSEVEILEDLCLCYQLLRGSTIFIEIHFSIIQSQNKDKSLSKSLNELKRCSVEFEWLDSSHLKISF